MDTLLTFPRGKWGSTDCRDSDHSAPSPQALRPDRLSEMAGCHTRVCHLAAGATRFNKRTRARATDTAFVRIYVSALAARFCTYLV